MADIWWFIGINFRNQLCVDSSKYCDGRDDCGDQTDEPPMCESCMVAIQTTKPQAICDGQVNCFGPVLESFFLYGIGYGRN